MSAGDMNWSDCGKSTAAQNFYPRKGRRGKKQVGGCGQYEARSALYAQRLPKRWKMLFKKKFNRAPSDEELWAALRTGEIAQQVYDWERQVLREEKNPPTKPHIIRSRDGRRITEVLAEYLAESKARKQAEIEQEIEEEKERIRKQDAAVVKGRIRQSSEAPIGVLRKLSRGLIGFDVLEIAFGISEERAKILLEAFDL